MQDSSKSIVNKLIYISFFLAVSSYKDLLNAVGTKRYYAGLMNSDVANYFQDEMHNLDEPLCFVKAIKKKMPVSILIPSHLANETQKLINNCFVHMNNEVVKDVVDKYRKYIKVKSIMQNEQSKLTKLLKLFKIQSIAYIIAFCDLRIENDCRCQYQR